MYNVINKLIIIGIDGVTYSEIKLLILKNELSTHKKLVLLSFSW